MDGPQPPAPNPMAIAIRFKQAELIHGTIRTAIRWAGIAIVAWFAKEAVTSLAGQNTSVLVSFVLNALVDIKFALAVTLGLVGMGWAFVERAFRYRKVEYLQGRIRQLETRIDPNRSTSGLTPGGKTNPQDKG
jgi:hypothetical protein